MARKSKDIPHLRLRVESSLLARLTKAAEKNERTLTGEIVDRLEASFKREDMQAYVDATGEKIAERLLAAAIEAGRRSIIDDVELDLQMLSEMYPHTTSEEHAEALRKLNARRASWRKSE